MAVQRLGIIMNGVTGRMGTNQHLVRSIVAIRKEGGVALRNGDRVMPDPVLVGRNAGKLSALADAHGIKRTSTNLGRRTRRPGRHRLLRCRHHPGASDAARPRPSTPASTSIARSRFATNSGGSRRHRAARPRTAGIKHGVVQDKLFLPGLGKLKLLIDSGFFGPHPVGARRVRLLGVRGRPAADAAAVLELSAPRTAAASFLDMLCHWRYVLDNTFGNVKSVSVPRRHAHLRAHRRGRQTLQGRPPTTPPTQRSSSTAVSSPT
jgi:predicted dehydrogenase